MTYDGADRHTTTTSAATTVRYTRDVTDRIAARTLSFPANLVARGPATGAADGAGAAYLDGAVPASAQVGDVVVAQVAVAGGRTPP